MTGHRTALVLRHDSAIGLGNLGPTLEAHGYEVVTVDAPSTDVSALDALEPDLVVVLGGDEAAYETDQYPYLADEIRLLETRVAAEAPVFGVCLGAQLLAKTLGAQVYRGPRKEVGWLEVEPTAAGADSPVRHFAGVPTVQWHGDSFELPEYGLTREQLREQRASYGPAANAASAALLGEYLEGLTAREAAERRSA